MLGYAAADLILSMMIIILGRILFQIHMVPVFRDLDVLVASPLVPLAHQGVHRKVSGATNNILRGTVCRNPEFTIQVFIPYTGPITY